MLTYGVRRETLCTVQKFSSVKERSVELNPPPQKNVQLSDTRLSESQANNPETGI